MKFLFQLFLAIGLVSTEKLDRTYLPPPGAKFSGGSPGDIQTPLEFPKDTYPTTTRPDDRLTHTDDSQIEVGINRGLPPVSEGPGLPTVYRPLAPSSKPSYDFQNIYKLPTTTTSYAFSQTTTHPPVEGLDNTVGPFGLITSGFPTTYFPDFSTTSPGLFTAPHLEQGQENISGYQPSGNIQQPGQVPPFKDAVSPSITPVSQSAIDQNRPGYSVEQRNQYQHVQQPVSNVPSGSKMQVSDFVSQFPQSEGQNVGQYQGFPTSVQTVDQPGLVTSNVPTSISPDITASYVNNFDRTQGQTFPGKNVPPLNLTPNQQSVTTQSDMISPGSQFIQQPGQQQYQGNAAGRIPSQQVLSQTDTKFGQPGFEDSQNVYTPSSTISPAIQASDFPRTPNLQTSALPDENILASTPIYTDINRGIIPSRPVNRPERPQAESDRNAVILNYENTITPEGEFAYSFDTSNGIHAEENGTSVDGVKAKGAYSYIGDDGKLYSIVYSADENGFQPRGDHLPTPPPVPEAIQKVIEQAIRDKEAGISDDGTYNDDKYGHKKYQGIMSGYRPIGSSQDVNKDRDVTKLPKNRYNDDGEIVSVGSEGKYIPSEEESGDDLKDTTVGNRRRPGSMISSKRPVGQLSTENGNEEDQDRYEGLPKNEYDRRRPINKIPERYPANRIPEDSNNENNQEFYDDLRSDSKKYPIENVPTKPFFKKQPTDVNTPTYEEDFADNGKVSIGNINFQRPSNQFPGTDVDDEKDNFQKYSSQRRPTTKIPSSTSDDRIKVNNELKYVKQGKTQPIEAGISKSQIPDKFYPNADKYSLSHPKDDTVEYEDQTEVSGDAAQNSNIPIVRGRIPSEISGNKFVDSDDTTYKSVSQTRKPYTQKTVTTTPFTTKRPSFVDRYNQNRDKSQTQTTLTPETVSYDQFEENLATGSPYTSQSGKQSTFKQQPIAGNKLTNLPTIQKESGYQYLPPQKKFEQGTSKFPSKSQEILQSTKIPSKYYDSKDNGINAKPFTTPSVTRDETVDNDYEHVPEDEQYGTSITAKPSYTPNLNQNQPPFTQQKDLNQYNGPEYNVQQTTPSRYDNEDTQNRFPGQVSPQTVASRRPSYQETKTTGRPYQQFRPGLEHEKSQDIEKQPLPGQDKNKYFDEKYPDRPSGSFGLIPSTASTPAEGTFVTTAKTDVYRPGQDFQVNNEGIGKRPGTQEYGYMSTTRMPSQSQSIGNIPSQSPKSTYRPTVSETDDYSRTPGFETSRKPGSKIPGRPSTYSKGQLPSTTYRPPFTLRDDTDQESVIDEFRPVSNKFQPNQGFERTTTYRPKYSGQDRAASTPGYQTPDDRMSTEFKPGFGRFDTPTTFPATQEGLSTTTPYRAQPTTQKVIGEDFSGPKQPQKFDPKYGYYY
ncbi:uncharacterized protein LOC116413062 [Galleria mellonella]|uniref:Uncharacterized protein LOC116413062 n=1 Tax=Galleria mellonella TaxID=7137 RepID=A0A6J3C467_GALME|nr:uncharacterized protein LOC116413062 [Galleria mellonella]